jgi:hypothetical protein
MSQNITEEWIRLRCTEDGDCLLWKLGVSATKRPIYKPLQDDGRRPTVQIARKWWEATRGPIPKGKCVTYTCGNPRCIEHLELITKGEAIRRAWKRPDYHAKRTQAVTTTARKRGKLDLEKARYIRNSPATLMEVAAELGICFQLASRVRRGEAWKERSPFAGLGA